MEIKFLHVQTSKKEITVEGEAYFDINPFIEGEGIKGNKLDHYFEYVKNFITEIEDEVEETLTNIVERFTKNPIDNVISCEAVFNPSLNIFYFEAKLYITKEIDFLKTLEFFQKNLEIEDSLT